MSSIKQTVISIIILITISASAKALEYSSYIFTTEDIIFFSYEDGTQVEIYDSSDSLIWPESGTVILDKGEHVLVEDTSLGVYKVAGSNKFAVLTGDAASSGVSGYYAMDANGLGVSDEFYTYVPEKETGSNFINQQFIVFGYEPNTAVTVQAEDANGVYQDVDTFTLDKGRHWADPNLSQKYLHVTANKPVSALTCYDQGYFVPSANGRWSGTEFYTYVSNIGDSEGPWKEDLIVTAYENGTSVTIKDSNDPNIVIWSGTLNSGDSWVVKCPQDANLDAYYTVESSKTVTVSVMPWELWPYGFAHGVFIPDRDGTGIGRYGSDIIGSTIN